MNTNDDVEVDTQSIHSFPTHTSLMSESDNTWNESTTPPHTNFNDTLSNSKSLWECLGRKVPRGEIVFFSQMIVIFTVVVVSLYNLTTHHPYVTLWTALLSSSLGYVLPNPRLHQKDIYVVKKPLNHS